MVISSFSILYTFTLDIELSHTGGFEYNALNYENTGKLKDCSVLSNHHTLMEEETGRLAENRHSSRKTVMIYVTNNEENFGCQWISDSVGISVCV
jgi:hypothetical protein